MNITKRIAAGLVLSVATLAIVLVAVKPDTLPFGSGSASLNEEITAPAQAEWTEVHYCGNEQAALEWTAAEGADGYELSRAFKKDREFEPIAEVTDGTSYVDSDLQNDRTYLYQIRAFAGDGDARLYSEPTEITLAKSRMGKLESTLTDMVGNYEGTWSVYVKRMDTGESFSINEQQIYAASMIKAFVMASLYDQIDKGELEDSDYVEETVSEMITVSSNEAYNELVALQGGDFLSGVQVVNEYIHSEGYDGTEVCHTLHPSSWSFQTTGGDNVTTVHDCGTLLKRIYRGDCVSEKWSKRMLKYLKRQDNTTKIPAGVPKGVVTANKTGETENCEHDMAIVYGPVCDYILVVMTDGDGAAVDHINEVSETVYQYTNS